MVELKDVKTLRVSDLKSELQQRGLSTDGKKAELVARLEEALKSLKNEEEEAQAAPTATAAEASPQNGEDLAVEPVEEAAPPPGHKHTQIRFESLPEKTVPPAAEPQQAEEPNKHAKLVDLNPSLKALTPKVAAPHPEQANMKKLSDMTDEERKKLREEKFKGSSEESKLKLRAMRFGLNYAPVEEEKKKLRKDRFGIKTTEDIKEEGEKKQQEERAKLEEAKKKRAERFGLAAPSGASADVPVNVDMLKKRAARFGIPCCDVSGKPLQLSKAAGDSSNDEVRKKARLERFSK